MTGPGRAAHMRSSLHLAVLGAIAATAAIGPPSEAPDELPGVLPNGAPLKPAWRVQEQQTGSLGAAASYMTYLLSRLHATWTAVNERLAGGCPALPRLLRRVVDRVRLLSLSRSYDAAGFEDKLHRQGRTSVEQRACCLEAAAMYIYLRCPKTGLRLTLSCLRLQPPSSSPPR